MRVIVVGGGVLGTMHALFAVRAGASVVHLEADPAPRRASVRNFGLIWVSGRAPGAELAVAQRARDLWGGIGATIPATGFRAQGSVTVALDDDEWAVLQGAAELTDAHERGFSLLDPSAVAAENPAVVGPAVRGALRCARDAVVEPAAVLGALRLHLARSGRYEVHFGREVVAAGPGRVRDHLGVVHEGDLVIACPGDRYQGLFAEVLGRAPLGRCRLQMMETEPFAGTLTTSVADVDSLRYYPAFASLPLDRLPTPSDLVRRERLQLLMVQRLDGSLTIGDTHDEDEPFPVGVTEAAYDHLRTRAEAILGSPLPAVRRRWAGVYSQPLDGSVCFRAEVEPGVWVVTGPGGRGMTLSPAIAEATLTAAGLVPSTMDQP